MQIVCHDFTNFAPEGIIFKGNEDKICPGLITGQNHLKNDNMTFSYQSFVVKAIILSGGSRGGARGGRPPLCFDQIEARKAEKILGGTGLPPYLKVWIPHCFFPLS